MKEVPTPVEVKVRGKTVDFVSGRGCHGKSNTSGLPCSSVSRGERESGLVGPLTSKREDGHGCVPVQNRVVYKIVTGDTRFVTVSLSLLALGISLGFFPVLSCLSVSEGSRVRLF